MPAPAPLNLTWRNYVATYDSGTENVISSEVRIGMRRAHREMSQHTTFRCMPIVYVPYLGEDYAYTLPKIRKHDIHGQMYLTFCAPGRILCEET